MNCTHTEIHMSVCACVCVLVYNLEVKDLEKETQLHTPSMLQVMVLPKLKIADRGMKTSKHKQKEEQQTIFNHKPACLPSQIDDACRVGMNFLQFDQCPSAISLHSLEAVVAHMSIN